MKGALVSAGSYIKNSFFQEHYYRYMNKIHNARSLQYSLFKSWQNLQKATNFREGEYGIHTNTNLVKL